MERRHTGNAQELKESMFKALKESITIIKYRNYFKKTKSNQTEIPELKSMIIEIKNSLKGPNNRFKMIEEI